MLSTNPPLAPALQHLVAAEVARGNTIREVSAGANWPPGCELIVGLARKFGRRYALPENVTFLLLADYHYWYAEYSFNNAQQLLICGFDD